MARRPSNTAKPTPRAKSSTPRKKSKPLAKKSLALNTTPLPASNEDSRQAIRLGFLIHDVSRLRRAAYDHMMKPLNITRARWWVLAHLTRHDGMMQSQLAAALDVGKASLGSVIGPLEADGWLERRADPNDRRARRIFLTAAAQPLIQEMIRKEDAFNRQILSSLSTEDRATLIRLLTSIKESVAKLPRDEPSV